MSLVGKLLSPSHVLVDLQASSKKRLFEQAGLLFENHDGIARSQVFDSLFARERLGSTGLGHGVALAVWHAMAREGIEDDAFAERQ